MTLFRGGSLGIREAINKKSGVSTALAICAFVVIAGVIALELRGNNGKPPAECYYTTDDGQTWFVDSSSKLAPFDHDGAQAVRCYVFKCNSGKFAGLLEKYSDATQKHLIWMAQQVPPRVVLDPPPVMVKRSGEKDWKDMSSDREGMMLMHDIAGPDGSTAERVMP
jgi:hypothetical protein